MPSCTVHLRLLLLFFLVPSALPRLAACYVCSHPLETPPIPLPPSHLSMLDGVHGRSKMSNREFVIARRHDPAPSLRPPTTSFLYVNLENATTPNRPSGSHSRDSTVFQPYILVLCQYRSLRHAAQEPPLSPKIRSPQATSTYIQYSTDNAGIAKRFHVLETNRCCTSHSSSCLISVTAAQNDLQQQQTL